MVAFEWSTRESFVKHLRSCCKYSWMIIFAVGTLLLMIVTVRKVSPKDDRVASDFRLMLPQIALIDPGCQAYFCSVLCANSSLLNADMSEAVMKTGCQKIDTFHIERQNFPGGVLPKNWANTGAKFYEVLITNSNLDYIAPEAFDSDDFTQTFILNLESIPLAALEGGALLGLAKLESLTIRSPIDHISRVFFQTIRGTLRTLKMNRMTESIQFNEIFGVSNMLNLEDLDLSGNQFYEPITIEGFQCLSKVRYLDLSKSQINVIGQNAFDPIKDSLKFLDLSHNNLTMLAYDTLDSILSGRVTYIYLSENNWSCDCHLIPLIQYYNNFSDVFLDVPICRAPQMYYGEVINVVDVCSVITNEPIGRSTATTMVAEFSNQTTRAEGAGGGSAVTPPTTVSSLVKLTCLSDSQSSGGLNLPDYMYLDPPSFDFKVNLIASNTAEVIIEEDDQEVTILWYSDPDIYGIYAMSTSDYGCRTRQNGSIIVRNLSVNVSYTFCIVATGALSVTPFNCLPFHIDLPNTEDDNIWIRTDDKDLTVAMFCLILLASCGIGSGISYALIKNYPDVLRGSKHVLMVKKSKEEKISTISAGTESRNLKRMAPPPPYQRMYEDDSSYETPIEVERIDYLERVQKSYSELFCTTEDAPKVPPPLPKRNSEQIYGISSKCNFAKRSI